MSSHLPNCESRAACLMTVGSVVAGNIRHCLSVKKAPAPPFEAQQRPNQQPVIYASGTVLIEHTLDIFRRKKVVEPGLGTSKKPVDIVDTLAPKPTRIGR